MLLHFHVTELAKIKQRLFCLFSSHACDYYLVLELRSVIERTKSGSIRFLINPSLSSVTPSSKASPDTPSVAGVLVHEPQSEHSWRRRRSVGPSPGATQINEHKYNSAGWFLYISPLHTGNSNTALDSTCTAASVMISTYNAYPTVKWEINKTIHF